MSISELKVLKARSPSSKGNETDWPSINLTHAEVFDSKTGEFASLLDAGPYTPKTIRGKIGALTKEDEKLRMPIKTTMRAMG